MLAILSNNPGQASAAAVKIRFVFRLLRLGVHLSSGVAQSFLFARESGVRRQKRIRRWSEKLLAVCGLHCEIHAPQGLPETSAAQLWAGNHISWLDIFAVYTVFPVTFVSKDDVRAWPLLGRLATYAGTVFLRRGSRACGQQVRHMLAEKLRGGQHMMFFPEGTTGSGYALQPFKSGLFQAALDAGADVRPVRIRYCTADGSMSEAAAYYGDITLWQSLRRLLHSSSLTVHIHILPAVSCQNTTRRALCENVRQSIENTF